jgi:hypothetical protein
MDRDFKRAVCFFLSLFIVVGSLYLIAGTDFFVMPSYFSNRKIRALENRLERIEKVLGIRDQVSSCIPSLEEQEQRRGF